MSTKIFPMRPIKLPKPVDPVTKAEAEAETKRRIEQKIEQQAKQAENKRARAQLRAQDLERRAQAIPELVPIPYILQEDWLDCIPQKVVVAWTRKKMVKFMRKNIQKQFIEGDLQLTQKILDAALSEPLLKEVHEIWVETNRQTVRHYNIDISDDEIVVHIHKTLGNLLAKIHDNFWRDILRDKEEWESDPYNFGQFS